MAVANETITTRTFYTVVAQIHISLFLVLMASGKPEDHWFRWFVIVYLILLVALWSGMTLWSRRSREGAKDATAAPGSGPAEGPK